MSVQYKDYYKILGVSKDASTDDINRAYKKLARKHHPDLNQGDSASEERFKEINEAHEVLKDPEKRKLYDHLGPNWQDGQNFQRPPGFENVRFTYGGGPGARFSGSDFSGSGFSDFFETLFGGGGFGGASFSQGGSFGQGASFSQGNPFSGTFNGFSQSPRQGNDVEAGLPLTLEEAYQGGKKTVTLNAGGGTRSLEVSIPAGVKQGARIRLAGQGEPGAGGPNGDLYLKVQIAPHPQFTLDDTDIVYDLTLAPWEAALGCKVRVPTVSGPVELNIAPGTGSGKKLRLRGRGLGSGSSRGDQLVRIGIAVPESLTDEERRLWEELRDVSTFRPRSD